MVKPISVTQSNPVEVQGSGPRLQVDVDSVDYGEVKYNDVVDQSFQITNVGKEPLNLQRVTVKTVEGC